MRFAVFRHAVVKGIHKRMAVGVTELDLAPAAAFASALEPPVVAAASATQDGDAGNGDADGGGGGGGGAAGAAALLCNFTGALPLRTPPASSASKAATAATTTFGAGELSICISPGSVGSLEQSVWERVITMGDLDKDGRLSRGDFVELMTVRAPTSPLPYHPHTQRTCTPKNEWREQCFTPAHALTHARIHIRCKVWYWEENPKPLAARATAECWLT